MSGRNRFDELTKDFTPSRRRRVDKIKTELRAELRLRELRQARALTQQQVAERLNVNQPAVAKLEQSHRRIPLKPALVHRGGRGRATASWPYFLTTEFEITTFSGVGVVRRSVESAPIKSDAQRSLSESMPGAARRTKRHVARDPKLTHPFGIDWTRHARIFRRRLRSRVHWRKRGQPDSRSGVNRVNVRAEVTLSRIWTCPPSGGRQSFANTWMIAAHGAQAD